MIVLVCPETTRLENEYYTIVTMNVLIRLEASNTN